MKKRTKWIIGIVSGIVVIGVLTAIGPPITTSTATPITEATVDHAPHVHTKGDVDCDGDHDAVDALVILLHVAGLPVNLPADCLPIGSSPATPMATATPTVVSFGNGTHEVGYDIQPGTYRSEGPESQAALFCSFARLKDAGAGLNLDNVIDIQNVQGPAIVNIDASDGGFFSQNCQPWVLRE